MKVWYITYTDFRPPLDETDISDEKSLAHYHINDTNLANIFIDDIQNAAGKNKRGLTINVTKGYYMI